MALSKIDALETTLRIGLKKGLPVDYLERVGRAIVAQIERRTAKGIDKNGQPFVPYSDEYRESLEFRIARKTDTVNLRLSGEMLGDLGVLGVNSSTGEILIGFEDSEQQAKAHGHITGGGTVPKRDFLGVSAEELATIVSKIPTPQQYEKAKILTKDIAKLMASDSKKSGSSGADSAKGVQIVDLYAEFDRIMAEEGMEVF
jgi:hypothetical protein